MTTIKIDQILVYEHLRKREPKDIESLMLSIKDLGLINPVTINRHNWLIAGYHRLLACKALGWTEIPVNIVNYDNLHAEMAQIDENIVRNNLTALQNALQLKRRKEIYEDIHPDSTRRAKTIEYLRNQARQILGNDIMSLPSVTFTEDAADKTSVSSRNIQRYIKIADSLSKDVIAMLKNTSLEDRFVDLLELARIKDPERQKELIQKVIDGEIKSVKGYLDRQKAAQRIRKVDLTKETVSTRAYMRLLDDYLRIEAKYYKVQAELDNLKSVIPPGTDNSDAA